MQFVVSYCRESTHWTNYGMISRKGRATVTLGRSIWQFPAIMQAYCITKCTLVKGKTMIIQKKYGELWRAMKRHLFPWQDQHNVSAVGRVGHKHSWIFAANVSGLTVYWYLDLHISTLRFWSWLAMVETRGDVNSKMH